MAASDRTRAVALTGRVKSWAVKKAASVWRWTVSSWQAWHVLSHAVPFHGSTLVS